MPRVTLLPRVMFRVPIATTWRAHATHINSQGTAMGNLKHKTSTWIALLYYWHAKGRRWRRLSGVHLHFAKNVTFRALNSQKKKEGDAKRHNQIQAALQGHPCRLETRQWRSSAECLSVCQFGGLRGPPAQKSRTRLSKVTANLHQMGTIAIRLLYSMLGD